MATIVNSGNTKTFKLSDFGTTTASSVTIKVLPVNGKIEIYNSLTGSYEAIQPGTSISAKAISAGLVRYNCDNSNGSIFTDKLAYTLDNSTVSSSLVISTTKTNIETTTGNQIVEFGNELNNVMFGNEKENKIYGFNGDDTVYAGYGNDLVFGGYGNDKIDGGIGADKMYGEQGNDIYIVDNVGDLVIEGLNNGTDTVNSNISYKLGENIENLTLIKTTNSTTTSELTGTGNSLNNNLTGSSGNDGLFGLGGNDVLYGGAGNDNIYGGEGNDVLEGGEGRNFLIGGSGNDSYYLYANANNKIAENNNEGLDTVYVIGSYRLDANIENLVLLTADTKDPVSSNVTATATGNELGNMIQGSAGSDVVFGLAGSDYLYGGLGNDYLYGGLGNDIIYGGEGNDLINGEIGSDYLFGGNGTDGFVFNTKETQYSVDRIMDFNTKDDTIFLENGIFTKLSQNGTINYEYFKSTTDGLAKDANDYIVYNKTNGVLSYDADGNGTGVATNIAVIDQGKGLVDLTYQDFLVI